MDKSELIMLFAIVAIIITYAFVKIDRQKWLNQHCKVIGEMSGDIGVGIGYKGDPVITYTPGKTGYKCDDGKQYWE